MTGHPFLVLLAVFAGLTWIMGALLQWVMLRKQERMLNKVRRARRKLRRLALVEQERLSSMETLEIGSSSQFRARQTHAY